MKTMKVEIVFGMVMTLAMI